MNDNFKLVSNNWSITPCFSENGEFFIRTQYLGDGTNPPQDYFYEMYMDKFGNPTKIFKDGKLVHQF